MSVVHQTLYTQKDLIDILGTPRQTLSRQLPEDGYFLINTDSERKVKAYPLSILPEDMRYKITAMELADEEEELLPAPEAEQPRKLKPWQNEALKARLWILQHVAGIAFLPENLAQAEREFAQQSQAGTLPADVAAILDIATAKKKGKGVSYSTLRSWRSLYQKHGSDALAPMDAKAPQTPTWLNGFLQAWQVPGRPSVKLVYERLTSQGAQLPSLRTVERWVTKLGKIEAGKGRLGMLDLKIYRIHSIRKSEDLLPTDIYTADGQSGKFYVQNPYTGKPFKPELVTVMDVATRMVVGFAAGLAENSLNTLSALTDAMGNHGVPAIFYSDRGPGFKNKMLDDPISGIMTRLGIAKTASLPGRAWSRGVIERAQGAIWTRNARMLPAFADKDSDRHQQRQLLNAINKDIIACGTSPKLMTWEQFLTWCRAVIDSHNNTPHSSLIRVWDSRLNKMRHSTPAEYWRELKTKTEIIKPAKDVLTDIARPQEMRMPHNGWIKLWTKEYYHADLEAYHGQKVLVGYDPNDVSKVWIRNMEGQLVCVASLNGNAYGYFPQSFVEQKREQRAQRQIKLLEQHIADIEMERKGQEVFDITPEEKAEIIEFRKEFYEPKFMVPETDLDKYNLWLQLEKAETLTSKEQEFFETYPQSESFRSGRQEVKERKAWREAQRQALNE